MPYPGPLRTSERRAKKDKAVVECAPTLAERLAVIDHLRAEASDPALKRKKEQQGSPGITPTKRRPQEPVDGVKSPRAADSVGTPVRTPRAPQHGTRNVHLRCFHSVLTFWREHKHERGPRREQSDEDSPARVLARYRIRDFSDPKYAATRQALAEIEQLEAGVRDWEMADAPVTAAEQRMQADHDAWCRG